MALFPDSRLQDYTISYQYENGKKTMKLTSPKTENSVRKIPFFGETREILERQFEKVKRKRVDLGERWRQPEGSLRNLRESIHMH